MVVHPLSSASKLIRSHNLVGIRKDIIFFGPLQYLRIGILNVEGMVQGSFVVNMMSYAKIQVCQCLDKNTLALCQLVIQGWHKGGTLCSYYVHTSYL